MSMNTRKFISVLGLTIFAVGVSNAQIIVETGSQYEKEAKEKYPNAVVWDPAKSARPNGKGIVTGNEAPVKEETTSAPAVNTPPANPPIDFPKNAEADKCYARCLVPDEFEYRDEEVVDKPAYTKTEKIPAVYETVYDTIIIKPAATKTVFVPATYESVTEEVLVTPAYEKWVKGKADKNCLSQDPKDCEVWCLYKIPAEYKKVTKKVELTPSGTRQEEVPAQTKVVPRRVLVEAERVNQVEVPATFKTVKKKVLIKKGGFDDWKEVLCEAYVTEAKISEIQNALVREGYDPGPVDNKMGTKTKDALIKYQEDHGLPIGNLNMETLKALGVTGK